MFTNISYESDTPTGTHEDHYIVLKDSKVLDKNFDIAHSTPSLYGNGITFNKSEHLWVARGTTGFLYRGSVDTYTNSWNGKSQSFQPGTVFYDNGVYICSVAAGGIYRSSDGFSWTLEHSSGSIGRFASNGSGTWIGIEVISSSVWDMYKSTNNGDTWTKTSMPFGLGPGSEVGSLHGFTYGNGAWVAVGEVNSGEVFINYSTNNGSNWSGIGPFEETDSGYNYDMPIEWGGGYGYNCIVYSSQLSKFFIGTRTGDLMYSSNGTTWGSSSIIETPFSDTSTTYPGYGGAIESICQKQNGHIVISSTGHDFSPNDPGAVIGTYIWNGSTWSSDQTSGVGKIRMISSSIK